MPISSEPLVSAIMPVYQGEAVLSRAIDSLTSQSIENWELLAIDDGSTDNSLVILEEYAKADERIRIILSPNNQGAGSARNRGIEAARGRYIAFIDADDEWLPEKLSKQIAFMKDGDYAFSCTSYIRRRNGQNDRVRKVPPRAMYSDIIKNNTVGTLTAIYDTKTLGKKLMPTIRRRQDFALWLSLLEATDAVYGLDEPLSIYHQGHRSLSSNKFSAAKDQWNFYRRHLDLNLSQSLFYFSHYAFNASKRHL